MFGKKNSALLPALLLFFLLCNLSETDMHWNDYCVKAVAEEEEEEEEEEEKSNVIIVLSLLHSFILPAVCIYWIFFYTFSYSLSP